MFIFTGTINASLYHININNNTNTITTTNSGKKFMRECSITKHYKTEYVTLYTPDMQSHITATSFSLPLPIIQCLVGLFLLWTYLKVWIGRMPGASDSSVIFKNSTRNHFFVSFIILLMFHIYTLPFSNVIIIMLKFLLFCPNGQLLNDCYLCYVILTCVLSLGMLGWCCHSNIAWF